jgi:hypothetical protein
MISVSEEHIDVRLTLSAKFRNLCFGREGNLFIKIIKLLM